MLSSNFRCDQIHNNHCHEISHTLLWYLTFGCSTNPQLELYCYFRSEQINSHCYELGHTLLYCLSLT
jgi:hypothetical protein